jgi:hypothetical protein
VQSKETARLAKNSLGGKLLQEISALPEVFQMEYGLKRKKE